MSSSQEEGTALRVLVIDDDPTDQMLAEDLLYEALGREGVRVELASSYAAGLEALADAEHDVCLVDYGLGRRTGIDLIREARGRGARCAFLVLTGREFRAVDVEAMEAGAADYLVKAAIEAPQLERAIRYALDRTRSERQLQQSRDGLLTILDSLRIGTLVTDEAGRVEFISVGCGHFDGVERDSAVGRLWHEVLLFDADSRDEFAVRLEASAKERQSFSLTWRSETGSSYRLDCDIEVHPTDASRRLCFLYDVSEIHDLREKLDRRSSRAMVGESPPMRRLYELIDQIAMGDWTVLIEGETGSGKELVARALHDAGHRSEGPFVAVNCAGLSESLLTSQLFGHRRGAFTGAIADQQGLFEAAHGGTIFLDEIGDISLAVQTSLLRVLQEREVTRVGETSPRNVDVRIIAATHRNLVARVSEGEFREDLLYRIRVGRIEVPPLRERRGDVPLLVGAFLAESKEAARKGVTAVSQAAMRLLIAHDWPGNVRELHSAVEYALIRCRKSAIDADDLPSELTSRERGIEAISRRRQHDPLALAEEERVRVVDALRSAYGNRSRAARLLGMSRSTFYRRLSELGLDEVLRDTRRAVVEAT